MHLFEVAFYAAGTLYALFKEQILLFWFMGVVGIYLVLSNFLSGLKDLSIRKKIMAGTWTTPSEGVIYANHPVNVQKVLNLIETLPKQQRTTLTHFTIKAIGQLLQSSPSINGKNVFGKYVKYNQADVSCVIDIDEGKDLAIVLIQDVHNKSVQEIAKFIKSKALEIKSKKGDADHRKRMGMIKYMPPFMVSLLMPVSKFIFHFLGISINALSVKANQFGGAVLTSIGMIGFENATAPVIGAVGLSMCVSLNAVCQRAVVEDGKIVIRKMVNVNFAMDGRYVDLIECKDMLRGFMRVFEEPQDYLKKEEENNRNQQKVENNEQRSARSYTLKIKSCNQISSNGHNDSFYAKDINLLRHQ